MFNKRFLRHLSQDILIWCGIVFGFWVGIDWVANVTAFAIVVFGLLVIIFGFYAVDTKDPDFLKTVAQRHRDKTKFHRMYSGWSTAAEVVVLCALGHFFLAAWWMFAWVVAAVGISHAEDEAEDLADAQ